MLLVICPHCNSQIEILELNCKIFRHGVYKKNHQQINPHASKSECDYLAQNDLIYGCGKPFQIIQKDNNYETIICDYI
jgi:DNA-directed RNA polymerase subunit RPC12/RpoP